MSSGDGRAAIAVSSAHRLYLMAAGTVIVHCLSHAAGMWKRRRNRHAHGDKDPCEQKHKQQSGRQAMHDFRRDKHKGHRLRTQVLL